ncbi:MAG: 2Fe-2S iron-sulfur cluster-binding protein [Pseudomonadota bacterium]
MIKLTVDGKKIETEKGTTLLQACLENGIYVPNLCYLQGMENPSASCRLCFVEIEGENRPVASCTVKVSDPMAVKTDSPVVRRLQRSSLQLLLSVHDVDCLHCPANKKCALQQMARFLKVGLKPKRLERFLKKPEMDDSHPFLNYYPNRCVLCGKCIHVCKKENGNPFLTFAKRGFDTVISFYGERHVSQIPCKTSRPCVEVCPVAAITLK